MSRLRRWLTCAVIGHSVDHCDMWNCVCFRCGLTWDNPRKIPRNDLGFWLSYLKLKAVLRLRPFMDWIRCPDCGKRFCRHYDDRSPF